MTDTHVHLLAGLDDGPPDADVALAMCRMLVAEGAAAAVAVAHQNPDYPENTPDRLRAAAGKLAAALAAERVPLAVAPAGEVMLADDFPARVAAGEYLTVGNGGRFVLVEQPYDRFLDPGPLAEAVRPAGLRLILAHAERYPELLFAPDRTEDLIRRGCLVQVTTRWLADPPSPAVEGALKEWVARGFVHLLGSDGHGIDRRQPRLKAGYAALRKWAGAAAAERIARRWPAAVLAGGPVDVPKPRPPRRSWFAKWFG